MMWGLAVVMLVACGLVLRACLGLRREVKRREKTIQERTDDAVAKRQAIYDEVRRWGSRC